MSTVLVLYYSRFGAVKHMAEEIAWGVESVDEAQAVLRTVPKVSTVCEAREPEVPESGAPYVTEQDLMDCDALAFGSPTRFGNMAAPMKYFWDSTSGLWATGQLAGKPAGVFSSTSSLHYGQETTLLSMMMPLFHHGCILVGLPPSATLKRTTTGGTPYGPTHYAGPDSELPLSEDEITLCRAFGARLAQSA
jgi:NAD(P)H dehydrogenase (quinone)